MKPVQNLNNLVWLDLEMTGLDPDIHRIIEIATVVTDSQLNVLAEGPIIAIHQKESALAEMDGWNVHTHTHSGLIERVEASHYDEIQAEEETLNFIAEWVPDYASPLCGNSICQDRRFLYRYMPRLQRYFHYRNLDVSTLKILAQHWAPLVAEQMLKNTTHTAMQDVRDSIEELKYYRQHLFKENPHA
ncbi:MAG TPA: oligoribonuclease [Coxiellaceae bacterium]|nr:oligoribonuclease [Coxiellaceae bacterium]